MHRHAPTTSHHSAPAIVAGAVLVLLAVSWLLAGCADDEPTPDPGYTPERRAEFLDACAEGAAPDVCRCAWDRITAEVPEERFVAVSEGIARGEPLPADLAAVAERCATEVVLDRG